MAQRAALGVLGVGQQGGGGGMGLGQVLRAPAGQAGGLELFQQLVLAQRAVELPFGAQGQGDARGLLDGLQGGAAGGAGLGRETRVFDFKYAEFIVPAFAVTAVVFAGMVWTSLRHAARWKKRFEELDRR